MRILGTTGRTPHSALRTPHSALRTPHSALRTIAGGFPPSNPPTAIEIDQATTPQAGGAIALTYVPGGGHDATSRRLEWQVAGVDPGYDHDVALNIVGQTLTGFTPGRP